MWQPQLTRRLRVLLHTNPILELRSWDMRRDSATRHYDSITLAMRILDHIIESTGLGIDADTDAVIRSLEPLMYQMDIASGIEPDIQRHRQFAGSLLGRLRNDEDARRPFKLTYTDFDGTQVVQRQLELRLIEEHFASDERVVLQLSSEAVNLFLNALDIEIEDAQAALEAIIQSQLERGRFDEAAASARDAKFRSIQFEDKIERILRETRRDVTRVDWRESAPKLLREALQHIDERLRIEKHIADSARQRLESLEPGSREAGQVALIAELMDECSDRHIRLHTMLMDARSVFFTEQDRQAFIPRPSAQLPNLFADVLEPLLAASKKVALLALEGSEPLSEAAIPALLGARAAGIFSLRSLVSSLLQARRETVRSSILEEEQVWFQGVPDILRFSSEVQQAAQSYLRVTPVHLSTLLERATEAGESQIVLEYLSLNTLQAFEGSSTMGLRSEPVGSPFIYNGFWGDDLELYVEKAAMTGNSAQDEPEEE